MVTSELKIAIHTEFYVVYMKYTIIKNRYDISYARAISLIYADICYDGKLILLNPVD